MFDPTLNIIIMKKNTLTILAAILMVSTFFAQTVTTYTDGTPDDAMVLDSNGNLYASNFVGDSVFKFDPDGNGVPFITGLNTPNGLAFDSNENLYVCDFSGLTRYKYDIDGNLLESFTGVGRPSGIIKAFDNDDMIFTNYNESSINRLEPDGTITVISSDSELNGPVGLAYDENGVLYAGNYDDRKIYRILNDGTADYIAQLPTDGGALPNLGFITYGQGRLWGTTMGSDKIYAVNQNEVDSYILFAGSVQGSMDGDIDQATFTTPNGILFSEDENTMCITDFGTKNIRIISDVILSFGEEALNLKSLQLFPNPVVSTLNVKTDVDGDYQIKVYNILGEVVYSFEESFQNTSISKIIDMSSLNTGVYLVKVSSQNVTSVKRFIKK